MVCEEKYSLKVIKITFGIMLLLLAINFFIDPYNRFGMNRLGVYISAEREFKVTEIAKFQPEWVLLGNSKSAMIDVSELENNKVFNAGFGSASIQEMVQFVDKYIPNKNVKLIIGLDLLQYSVGGNEHKNFFYVNTFGDITKYLFSIKSLEYSGKTIGKYFRNKPKTLFENGSYNAIKWYESRDVDDQERAKSEILHTQKSYLSKVEYQNENMNGYLQLRDLLNKKGHEAVFFIHPIHKDVMSFVDQNMGKDLRKWKAKIKEIFPKVIDLSDSSYSDQEYFFKTDPVHYYPSVGKELLKQILKDSV